MPPAALIFLIVVIAGAAAWGAYQIGIFRAAAALTARLKAEGVLLIIPALQAEYRVITIGGSDSAWRSCLIAITSEQLTFYRRKPRMDEHITFPRAALRWYGRPVKYHDGRNELWLHFEQDGRWYLVMARMSRYWMADLVRAVKEYGTPQLVTAYRRHRPYVHYGAVRVEPAEQDIHGAWTLQDPLLLYVTPAQIVLLRDTQVLRVLPIEQVQQIAALRRIDRPEADGLVVFNAEGEKFAFAHNNYEALAQAIAEAAKRSLEVPLLQKQKDKDDGEPEDEQ